MLDYIIYKYAFFEILGRLGGASKLIFECIIDNETTTSLQQNIHGFKDKTSNYLGFQVPRKLVRRLVAQMIHWFTNNAQYENPETIALLQCCLDAICDTWAH
ncbi:28387_t:CDS:2 [Gigaspora margarita]|uniref:28387_t:CDS:1 n=1 Tax=Gigaspora margarita TaxID=4874 RepID=A0ABM8VYT9_GIGMA|nr:28387_t:CDS:2 [Gigaspora margarita]